MIRTLATGRFFPKDAHGATLPVFSAAAILKRVGGWIALARQRQQLASLDASLLRDIGVGAGDVAHESARPFWDAPKHWRG